MMSRYYSTESKVAYSISLCVLLALALSVGSVAGSCHARFSTGDILASVMAMLVLLPLWAVFGAAVTWFVCLETQHLTRTKRTDNWALSLIILLPIIVFILSTHTPCGPSI